MSEPTNNDDVIDSRDVIARIRELEDERDADSENRTPEEWAEHYPDDAAELAALKSLESDAEGYCDWVHGAALIRDSYFKAYAQQYAEDCGLIDGTAPWPTRCIDWDQAARELQMDFTAVEFDGITYWVQS